MSTAGILSSVVLVLITLGLVIYPLVRRHGEGGTTTESELSALQAQYERTLTNIRDLDEDYALGKIQQDFYDTERSKFTARGIELLQKMDELRAKASSTHGELEDEIEAAIAAKRRIRQD